MAYKYSCRKCPIRNRCIDESVYTESVKNMIGHAFAGRTDTLSTWGLLQTNCLLIKAEEEQAKKAREGSALGRRLRQARAAREQEDQTHKKTDRKTENSPIRRLSQARKRGDVVTKPRSKPQDDLPDYLRPVSSTSPLKAKGRTSEDAVPQTISSPDTTDKAKVPPKQQLAPNYHKLSWLTVSGSGRHIALPDTGELVLGRFDAAFGIPPDIDLVYEDHNEQSVSRRHAKIVGRNGVHTVEDTGSRLGVFVNRDQIKPGFSRQLKSGDTIAVGNVKMFYDEVPAYLQEIAQDAAIRHLLMVTPTGRKLEIFPPDNLIIGRSDRYFDFVPNIDLREDGEVAVRVSRRHAIIHWKDDRPYVEDLGSGFGTRINGEMMLIGQAVPLKPGDHIWLGGCVLAYDVEL